CRTPARSLPSSGSLAIARDDPLALPDILVPQLRPRPNELAHHLDAIWRSEVHDAHAILAKPVEAAGEIDGVADDERADPELAHEPAAVPAGREGRREDLVAIGLLAARLPKGVGLPVNRGIPLLDPAVPPAAEQAPIRVEERGADGHASFREARP